MSFARAGVLGPGTVLQRDLDIIFLVSSSWNLKLNAEKCVVMRFGSRERFGGEVGSGYFLDGAELRLVGEQRDLGLVIDPSLKFHSHVNVTVRGIYSVAGRFLRADLVKVWKILNGMSVESLVGLFDRRSHGATRGH